MGEQRIDVKIAGDGALNGGTYGAVTVNGAGSINGDVDCTSFRVNGAGTLNGKLLAKDVTVNGTATFKGEVQSSAFNVNGDASIREGAGISQLKVKGNMSVGGGLAAHDVDVRGLLNVAGDCETETFTGEGAFTVGGMLNAGTLDVRIYGPCKAREIGGERIIVNAPRGIAQFFTFFAEKRLTVDVIEGDEISLENVTAKVVRGGKVTIGEGCDIETVEYVDEFYRGAAARVGTATKVEAAEA